MLIRNRKRAFLLCACTAVLIYLDLRWNSEIQKDWYGGIGLIKAVYWLERTKSPTYPLLSLSFLFLAPVVFSFTRHQVPIRRALCFDGNEVIISVFRSQLIISRSLGELRSGVSWSGFGYLDYCSWQWMVFKLMSPRGCLFMAGIINGCFICRRFCNMMLWYYLRRISEFHNFI